MTTARERMLQLSPLPTGNTARAHFLAITQTGGTIELQLFNELSVELEDDFEVSLEGDFCE